MPNYTKEEFESLFERILARFDSTLTPDNFKEKTGRTYNSFFGMHEDNPFRYPDDPEVRSDVLSIQGEMLKEESIIKLLDKYYKQPSKKNEYQSFELNIDEEAYKGSCPGYEEVIKAFGVKRFAFLASKFEGGKNLYNYFNHFRKPTNRSRGIHPPYDKILKEYALDYEALGSIESPPPTKSTENTKYLCLYYDENEHRIGEFELGINFNSNNNTGREHRVYEVGLHDDNSKYEGYGYSQNSRVHMVLECREDQSRGVRERVKVILNSSSAPHNKSSMTGLILTNDSTTSNSPIAVEFYAIKEDAQEIDNILLAARRYLFIRRLSFRVKEKSFAYGDITTTDLSVGDLNKFCGIWRSLYFNEDQELATSIMHIADDYRITVFVPNKRKSGGVIDQFNLQIDISDKLETFAIYLSRYKENRIVQRWTLIRHGTNPSFLSGHISSISEDPGIHFPIVKPISFIKDRQLEKSYLDSESLRQFISQNLELCIPSLNTESEVELFRNSFDDFDDLKSEFEKLGKTTLNTISI